MESVHAFVLTEEAVRQNKMLVKAPGRLKGIDLAVATLVVRTCSMMGRGAADDRTDKVYLSRWKPATITRRIREAHILLRGRVRGDCCTNLDAVDVIRAPGPCVIFCDPPYPAAKPTDKPVYLYDFTDLDHQRLARALHETDQPWFLSYGDHRLPRALYAKDFRVRVTVDQHGTATRGRKREPVPELLICPEAHRQLLVPGDGVRQAAVERRAA